jgi:hypothetical protein
MTVATTVLKDDAENEEGVNEEGVDLSFCRGNGRDRKKTSLRSCVH